MRHYHLFRNLLIKAFLFCFLLLPCLAQGAQETGAEFVKQTPPPPTIKYRDYSSLPELISSLCDEADGKFKHFYGPGLVAVTPFVSIGEDLRPGISKLGVTLADQMVAVINSNTITLKTPKTDSAGKQRQDSRQRLSGLLEEMDGYLRIHISGVNYRGQRISYVTNVEMSAPLYRAMHSYIK
ncbi:hypothetical protein ACOHYD_07065 [Desulfobacterota bacterium M19]